MVQRLPPHEFHGEEIAAILGVTGLINCRNIGMFEATQGLDLALEHLCVKRINRMARSHDLERDPSPGAVLLRLEDNTHAAFTKLGQDRVVANGSGHTCLPVVRHRDPRSSQSLIFVIGGAGLIGVNCLDRLGLFLRIGHFVRLVESLTFGHGSRLRVRRSPTMDEKLLR